MSSNGSSNSSNSLNSSNSSMSTQTNKITPETMIGSTSLLGLMRDKASKENGIRKTGINGKEACSYLRMLVINPQSQFHGLEITNILFPALVSAVGEKDKWSETKFYRLNHAANSSRWTWVLATHNSRRKSSSNRGKRSPKKQSELKPMTFRTNDGATKNANRTYGYGDYGEQYTLRQMIEACHMEEFNGQPNLECDAKTKSIPEGLLDCLEEDEFAPTSKQLKNAEVAFWEKCIDGSANNEGSTSTTTNTTISTSVWSRFDVMEVLRDYPFNVQRMLLKLFVKHIKDMDESTGKMLLNAYHEMILEDSKRIEEFERQACYQINKVTDGIFKGQRRALDALGIESVEHPDKPKGQPYGKEVNGKRKLGYQTTGGNWKPLSNHRLTWVCDPNGPKNLFMTEVTSNGAEVLNIPFDSMLGSTLKMKKNEEDSSSGSSDDESSSSSSDDDDDESKDESKKKKKKKKKQVESSEEKEGNDEDDEEVEEEDDEEEVTKQVKSKKKKKKVEDDDDDEEEEDDHVLSMLDYI